MVIPAGVSLDFQGNLYTEGMTVPKDAEALIPQPAKPAPTQAQAQPAAVPSGQT